MPRRLGKCVRELAEKLRFSSLLRVVLNSVALEVNLGTLREKALTTLTTAARDDVATGFGGHACAEAMLAFTDALGRLVGSLHGALILKNAEMR